jgi:hypothetical protein
MIDVGLVGLCVHLCCEFLLGDRAVMVRVHGRQLLLSSIHGRGGRHPRQCSRRESRAEQPCKDPISFHRSLLFYSSLLEITEGTRPQRLGRAAPWGNLLRLRFFSRQCTEKV